LYCLSRKLGIQSRLERMSLRRKIQNSTYISL